MGALIRWQCVGCGAAPYDLLGRVVLAAVGVPGTQYLFQDQAGNRVDLTLADDGTWAYDAALESFLSGSGTNAVVVDGFEVTVDATN